jgi:hypothetical protein
MENSACHALTLIVIALRQVYPVRPCRNVVTECSIGISQVVVNQAGNGLYGMSTAKVLDAGADP